VTAVTVYLSSGNRAEGGAEQKAMKSGKVVCALALDFLSKALA